MAKRARVAMHRGWVTAGSRFEGLDPSQHAIGRARRRAAENGLENAEFRTAGAEDLPGYGSALTASPQAVHSAVSQLLNG